MKMEENLNKGWDSHVSHLYYLRTVLTLESKDTTIEALAAADEWLDLFYFISSKDE